MKIVEDDALNKKVLVVSTQSAFEIDYLVELVTDVGVYAATFESVAKKFNRYHNPRLPQDTLQKRQLLYRKRVADAYFLYVYILTTRSLKLV